MRKGASGLVAMVMGPIMQTNPGNKNLTAELFVDQHTGVHTLRAFPPQIGKFGCTYLLQIYPTRMCRKVGLSNWFRPSV